MAFMKKFIDQGQPHASYRTETRRIGRGTESASTPACFSFSSAGIWLLLNGISWDLYLPYLAGAITLIMGVICVRKEIASTPGADKIIVFGPIFLAVPMAVFGAEHFMFAEAVVAMVPSWIPWHLFWALLVGLCLIAGALSLVLRRCATLAAALFGTMLFLFVLLIHIPKIAQAPGDRFAWAVALRDLAFGAGALSFAAAQAGERWRRPAKNMLIAARFFIGIPVVLFALEHFLHPEFKPGVPLKQLTPPWVPAHVLLAYMTGAILLITGLGLICNRGVKLASTGLGLLLLLLVLVIYVPIVIAQPSAIGSGLNYLADTLLLSGSALCFAGTQREVLVARDA